MLIDRFIKIVIVRFGKKEKNQTEFNSFDWRIHDENWRNKTDLMAHDTGYRYNINYNILSNNHYRLDRF